MNKNEEELNARALSLALLEQRALTNLLIKKGVFTKAELKKETDTIFKEAISDFVDEIVGRKSKPNKDEALHVIILGGDFDPSKAN